MSRYNLIDEKWIPVRDLEGKQRELGILDVLTDAEHLTAIEDPSPLVTAALHRFLLAVLYRALEGPCDIDDAKKLFREGFPKEKIKIYLEKWRDRFWLFDEKYPFGQIPEFKPKVWQSWTRIAAEHNADNAKVLFDHVDITAAGSITNSKTVKWLLATQTFSVSAGKSELAHTGTAPSAGVLLSIPIGRNLCDTFLFCLVPQNVEIMKSDLPFWESEPDSVEYLVKPVKIRDKKNGTEKDRAVERPATGIVDIYTWLSRTIVLKPQVNEYVSELGLASGIGFAETKHIDPMVGFTMKEMKDEATNEKVMKPVAIRFEEKGAWRDFDSLLPDEAKLAPKVIENAILLCKRDLFRFPKGILVVGQRYYPPRPNIAFWRKEFFILPGAAMGDKYIRGDIRSYLQVAEDVNKVLYSACANYAQFLLSRGARSADKKDIKSFIEQLTVLPNYWAILESKFHEMLRSYTIEKKSEDIRYVWLIEVKNALSSSWDLHKRSISGCDAWAIRALVKAEDIIAKKVAELNKTIQTLKEVP